jgi:hypothetical protein
MIGTENTGGSSPVASKERFGRRGSGVENSKFMDWPCNVEPKVEVNGELV